MSEQPLTYLTDPEIAARIRRAADDLAVDRQRAATASEGIEAGLRELADEVSPAGHFESDQTKGVGDAVSDQGRLL